MTENALYEQLAQYLALQHAAVIYHFDLSGMWTPSHQARNLYGRLNRRAWPDLFVANADGLNVYSGLFIELKRDGTRLHKQDGSWAKPHIEEQAEMLEQLRHAGYMAEFAVGFDAAKALIDAYLSGRLQHCAPQPQPSTEGINDTGWF